MKGYPLATAAVYGTMGVANASNTPGSQNRGITWCDAAGNLWLYGGYGTTATSYGYLSDLWKYVPSTNNWTWISGPGTASQAAVYGTMGIGSTSNTPGARAGAASWIDSNGDFWLFGGFNATGIFNDLWRYSIVGGAWTWMGGTTTSNASPVYGPATVPTSSAMPRASYNLVSWKDPLGNFWMYDGVYGNEVWRYNPTSTQWTYMSGTSTSTAVSNAVTNSYGTQGVFSPTVFPGARYTSGAADALGNLYIFGGQVYTATGFGRANDLWKYNITTNQWAWLGGTQSTSSAGAFGTQGVFSATTIPNGRYGHTMWADNTNNRIWLFSGEFQTLTSTYWTNDTWCYDVATNQWAWMKGNSTFYNLSSPGPGAIYGTQTIPGQTNTPGWHVGATTWPSSTTTMWLFSGTEWNGSNELWKFGACTNSISVSISSSQQTLCPGSTATLSASGTATAYTWNTGAVNGSIAVSPTAASVYTVTGINSNCVATATFVLPISTLSITSQNTAPFCSGTTFTLSAGAGGTYTWTGGQNTASITVNPSTSSVYQVSATINACPLTASYALNVQATPTLTLASNTSSVCAGQSATLSCSGANFYSWNTSQSGALISVSPNTGTVYSVVGMATSGCSATAQVSISVVPIPILTVSASSASICSGSSVSLSALGASSYSWSTGATSSSVQVVPTASTIYTVRGTALGCSASSVIAVQVQASPTIMLQSSSAAICAGQTVQLVATGANTYFWSSGATAASITVSLNTSTLYTVIGSSGACSASAGITQVVNPLPTITISAANQTICAGESTILSASGAASYTWSSPAINSSTLVVAPSTNQSYTVAASDANACTNTAAIAVSVLQCNGLFENRTNVRTWQVTPNPNSGTFSITGAENETICVYASNGQLLFEKLSVTHALEINHTLPAGLYYCGLRGSNTFLKIVVQY